MEEKTIGRRSGRLDGGLKFDYYYGAEAEQFSFYRVPRLLIVGRRIERDANCELFFQPLSH